jgi:hypothetical protein
MRYEFNGVLTKVFYSGNAKLPGGEYTLTFLDLGTKEEVELYFKSLTKVEFDMSKQYVYKVIHDDGVIKDLKIKANSVQDYLNNNLVEYKNNIVNSKKSKLMFILHWLIVIIICVFISLLILK